MDHHHKLICLHEVTVYLPSPHEYSGSTKLTRHYLVSLLGGILWLTGLVINIHSDHILRNLRKPGETGYKIPRGKSGPGALAPLEVLLV